MPSPAIESGAAIGVVCLARCRKIFFVQFGTKDARGLKGEMDILALFRGSPEKQIERLRKKVKEPHGDASVRINAAHKLYQMGTPEAILALLDRFKINTSPSRQDDEEKEEVLGWIVSFGERAVEPLTIFLKRERQVYWPARALKEILPEDRLVARLNEILLHLWECPPASPEPKAQLIRSLQGLRSPELEETVRLFVEARDDDVCLAAVDYLFESEEERNRESVLQCYLDSPDRPRIRAQILERLAEKGWNVKGFRPGVEETLPEGYTLTRDGVVKSIGRKA